MNQKLEVSEFKAKLELLKSGVYSLILSGSIFDGQFVLSHNLTSPKGAMQI